MYAIVDIAGQQFKVEKDQKIYVHRLDGKVGSKVDFDKVLLIGNNKNLIIGTPVIEGAMVYASILEHLKDDKVLVFKKKRKKGYRKLNGHRQFLSRIIIEDIVEKGAKSRIVAEKSTAVATKKIKEEKKIPVEEIKIPAETAVKEVIPSKPEVIKSAMKPSGKKTVKLPASSASGSKKVMDKEKAAKEKPSAVKKTKTTKAPVKVDKPAAAKKPGGKKTK